jgi:hypothetical protein
MTAMALMNNAGNHAKHAFKVALFQMPTVTSPEEFPMFLPPSVKMCGLIFSKCDLMRFRAISFLFLLADLFHVF